MIFYLASSSILLIAVFYLFAKFAFTGTDLRPFDLSQPVFFYDGGEDESVGEPELEKFVRRNYIAPKGLGLKKAIAYVRNGYEVQGRTRHFKSQFKSAIAKIGNVTIPGEWTIPENADPTRRMLFLHGGAFMIGSPISHRPITDNLARRTKCVVFTPDYRLSPEHGRKDGILDCQKSYEWLLKNGPEGPAPTKKIVVAGDSAGGNLSLMLGNWTRDLDIRIPDAIVAMSPGLDTTASGPSMRSNVESDVILGPAAGPLNKLPRFVYLWLSRFVGKINPAHALASPIFASLHDLPPTLIQVSNTEILFDDARRYTAKANQAGSPITLQVWRGQAHVWQHYDEIIPEAHLALDEIAKFLGTYLDDK